MRDKRDGRKKIIVYLKLKPDLAKELNLPVKLPVLLEDFQRLDPNSPIPLEVILRGLEAQISVDPKDDYYRSYLVYVYYEMLKKCMKDGKFDEAFKYLEKAGKLLRDHRYHFYRGLLLREMKNFDDAEIELRRSIDMKKDFSIGYFELGNLLYAKKEYDEALKMYLKAWESESTFLLPLLKMADLYIETGDLKSAKDVLLELTRKDENFSIAFSRLGVIENIRQNFKKAVEYFRKALSVEPRDWETRYNLSYSLMKIGDLFGAMRELEEIIGAGVERAEVFNEHSIICRNVGLYEKSLDSAQRAVELDEGEPYKITLARSLLIFDEYERASSILREISSTTEVGILALKLLMRASFEFGDIETLAWSLDLLKRYNAWSPKVQAFENSLEKVVSRGSGEPFETFSIDLIEIASDMLENEELEGSTIDNLRYIVETGGFNPTTLNEGKIDIIPYISSILSEMKGQFLRIEKELNRIAIAFHGSSETLASLRILLRLYEYFYLDGDFEIEEFLDEVIPEMGDLNWYFARNVVRKIENMGSEMESILDDASHDHPKKLLDFVIDLIVLSTFKSKFKSIEQLNDIEDPKLRRTLQNLLSVSDENIQR